MIRCINRASGTIKMGEGCVRNICDVSFGDEAFMRAGDDFGDNKLGYGGSVV